MPFVWIGLALVVIAALTVAASRWAFNITFYSPHGDRYDPRSIPAEKPQYQAVRDRMIAMVDRIEKIPFERVYITSHDGLRLAARYYHIKDGAPLDICFHGYRGHALRDFCGGAMAGMEMGHNVLLIDERAHGESQGKVIAFGIKERIDCKSWIDYAITRFGGDVSILLYGISMGGATVLMASGLELPVNVKGIVADCPYSSPKEIILDVAKKMHFPPKLVFPLIALGARLFGGFDVCAVTAEEAVKHATVPILIMHGDDDRFVPAHMSEGVPRANPQLVTRHLFAGAGHGLCYLTDKEKYIGLVRDFSKQLGLL